MNYELKWIGRERFKGLREDKTKMNWEVAVEGKTGTFVILAPYKITFAEWSSSSLKYS